MAIDDAKALINAPGAGDNADKVDKADLLLLIEQIYADLTVPQNALIPDGPDHPTGQADKNAPAVIVWHQDPNDPMVEGPMWVDLSNISDSNTATSLLTTLENAKPQP
jgi:hypothetical protein